MWAVHRRIAPPSQPFLASEVEQSLLIDPTRHEVIRAGQRLQLTSTELRLLDLLVARAGVLLTHEVLLRHVWGEGYGMASNYLRVYVGQLRKKLGDQAEPRLIETTPGVGYRWIGATPPVTSTVADLIDVYGSWDHAAVYGPWCPQRPAEHLGGPCSCPETRTSGRPSDGQPPRTRSSAPKAAQRWNTVLTTSPLTEDLGKGTRVREGGLEPPCPLGHTALNRARLPFPPLARGDPQEPAESGA